MPSVHAVQTCTMQVFLMTIDAEIALSSSWDDDRRQVERMSGTFHPEFEPRVRELEKRWTLVNRRLWKINNQFDIQFPQF